jgi:murein DD-endopeptidase MepM/ murein hydrolase activator NlpD
MGQTGGDFGIHLHFEVRKEANIRFNKDGSVNDIRRGSDNFWITSAGSLQSGWVDLGPIYGYDKGWPY